MPEEIEGLAPVVATGRSDYPNQINNVLAFPGVFRGALDVRASAITEEMKLAAAEAIAAVVKPDELSATTSIPSVFNRDVAPARRRRGRRRRRGERRRPPPPGTRSRSRRMGARVVALAAVLVATFAAPTAARRSTPAGLPLRLVADVPLPGGSSRFDYQSLDAGRNRLYLSHLAAASRDRLRRRAPARERARSPACRACTASSSLPRFDRVYAAATDARELVTLDELTGAVVRRIPAGGYPDGIAYDPADRKVFVSDEAGSAVIVADARAGRPLRIGRRRRRDRQRPVRRRLRSHPRRRPEP